MSETPMNTASPYHLVSSVSFRQTSLASFATRRPAVRSRSAPPIPSVIPFKAIKPTRYGLPLYPVQRIDILGASIAQQKRRTIRCH